jgi:hypothetical protein
VTTTTSGVGTSTAYSKSYNAFAGVDTQVIFIESNKMFDWNKREDFVILGEAQGINYKQHLEHDDEGKLCGRTVLGTIVTTIFDREPIPMEYYTGHDIILRFSNEYGNTMKVRISEVRITTMETGVSIDDLMMDGTYTFEATAVHFS